jgi:hypothetical protein
MEYEGTSFFRIAMTVETYLLWFTAKHSKIELSSNFPHFAEPANSNRATEEMLDDYADVKHGEYANRVFAEVSRHHIDFLRFTRGETVRQATLEAGKRRMRQWRQSSSSESGCDDTDRYRDAGEDGRSKTPRGHCRRLIH